MSRSKSADVSVVLAALEDALGSAVILDSNLAVIAATELADELAGAELVLGASLPQLLCGEAERRPVAEAMAAGQSVTAVVMRPASDGVLRPVLVRANPIRRKASIIGWVVLLDEQVAGASNEPVEFHGMWTGDPGMKQVFHVIERAARRDVNVLVRGESGTGKELVARALHALSPRHAGPFQAVNCAALPATLLESALFGHKRGSFTGATSDSPGIFRAAHGGTLFLDEVGEMPLELQAKLLRVLETRTVIPVGATESIAVDVRIVAATHQSLRRAVEAGTFRADLMYRLRVVPVFLPPLRQRPGDVALLTDKLIDRLNRAGERTVDEVSRTARQALDSYSWPGNVRELMSALEYAYVIGDGTTLVESDLPGEILGIPSPGQIQVNAPLVAEHDNPEVGRILRALERAAGNRDRAARSLGMSRVTLWRRMRALGILESGSSDTKE